MSLNLHLPPAEKSRRPSCWSALPRWLLYLGFALFGLAGLARMVYSITNWYWLNFVGIRLGPLYTAITGGLWGIVGLGALMWIILSRPWYRLVGSAAALFFALSYWADRLFAMIPPPGGNNTIFAATLTLFGLAYVFLALRPLDELHSLLLQSRQ